MAFLFLIFVIPLPQTAYQVLSQQAQLISSELGVALIRMCNISVYLEGNVIDLGSYQLQVVEACDGLRYLFPLMCVAFICAYFYKERAWKKVFIFLSSVPITIVLNSARIAIIGILVDNWGPSMAEGFLHSFEGWAVFMVCTAVLVAEMWLLARLGGRRKRFGEVFDVAFDTPTDGARRSSLRPLTATTVASVAIVASMAVMAHQIDERVDNTPSRQPLDLFPMQVADWKGSRQALEKRFLDALKLDDYLLAAYQNDSSGAPIQLYVAYYADQRTGGAIHSPRTCIPGGGWKIADLREEPIQEALFQGQPLKVNRVLIKKGEQQMLVHYWFQQRGRNDTNEYVSRWNLFWDALTINRTDGALIRVSSVPRPGETIEDVDRRLRQFNASIIQSLPDFVPGRSG